MLIIPAIDLRGGRCVRLVKGDFERETSYSDDPVEVARGWVRAGARRLHVVDLDGARSGHPSQLSLVAAICQLGLPVQVGGGLREFEHVCSAIEAGVDRVILGTIAVENPMLIDRAVSEYGPERIVLGVDARNGYVAVRGWEELSAISAIEIIERAAHSGVERVVYTDIDRDGTLTSPNFEETARVAAIGPAIIASGGVASWDHLRRLSRIRNVEAAIVGRALYDGTIRVESSGQWWVDEISAGTGSTDERSE